jgi:hypothetical protein
METFLDFKVSIANYVGLTKPKFSPKFPKMLSLQKTIHMELNSLTAISPIDGRYRNATAELAAYFSEFALIKYRVLVEIEYFLALHSSCLYRS